MKRKSFRVISVLLALFLLVTAIPLAAYADDDDPFRVIISVEGNTLGQGMYVEPTVYTIDRINALLAAEGYGPYTKRNLTAGMATLAMLKDKGLEYRIIGDWNKVVYLKGIKGVDTGKLDIPALITAKGGPSNAKNDGNRDAFLDEYDYSEKSGWMITVNDFMITGSISKFGLETNNTVRNKQFQDYGNTYVIRWQYTLWDYGLDLGYKPSGADADAQPYFEHANKDMLYAAYAQSEDAKLRSSALPVMEKLTATQAEVDAALAAFSPAPDAPEETYTNFLQRIINFFRRIFQMISNLFSR